MQEIIKGIKLFSPFVAAPMAGVSSPAFRLMARRAGAALVYSEMISAAGLVRGRRRTEELTRVLEKERPLGLQIFGADPETMHQAAQRVSAMPVDILDINMGCPVKKVRKQGAGAALLDDPVRAAEVVAAVKAGASQPVTVKMRLGYNTDLVEEILPSLVKAGAEMVCLHARTTRQGYSGRADWGAIARLKSWSPVPVIGNGDVRTPADALEMMSITGCDLVMIGRGALGNPWIFTRALDLWAGREPREVSLSQIRAALWEHIRLARKLGGEPQAVHFAKQFMMWYSKGLPGSSAFRSQAGKERNLSRLLNLSAAYFDSLEPMAA